MKIEMLSRDPEFVQIYDMVGEEAIKELKRLVPIKTNIDNKMWRHVFVSLLPSVPLAQSKKIFFSYIKDYSNLPRLTSWYRNIKLLTGLDTFTDSLEPLRILHHTFAGNHQPHNDIDRSVN